MISAILAMSENRVIGNNNALPWHLPADLQHFKKITMGKPILMGRKTFESIGRPLPGRLNIIITHNTLFHAEGCLIVHSIEEALSHCVGTKEIMLIGGAHLFTQLLPRIDRLYLTVIHHSFQGDVYFPELDKDEWEQKECIDHTPDGKNPYFYSFITYHKACSLPSPSCAGRREKKFENAFFICSLHKIFFDPQAA